MSVMLGVWTVFVWTVFVAAGIFSDKFLTFGASDDLFLFNTPINTGWKYFAVCMFTAVDQCMLAIGYNVVAPWISNGIQDPKTTTLIYTKQWVKTIRVLYTVFFTATTVMRIAIVLAQVGFIVIMVIVRCLMVYLATEWNIRDKTCASAGMPALDLDSPDGPPLPVPSDSHCQVPLSRLKQDHATLSNAPLILQHKIDTAWAALRNAKCALEDAEAIQRGHAQLYRIL
jgi:hypothetical protein